MKFLLELCTASAVGSVLWLALLLLCPLTRKIFSSTWHYYAGLIPAVFLLNGGRLFARVFSALICLIPQPAAESAIPVPRQIIPPKSFIPFENASETVARWTEQAAQAARQTEPAWEALAPHLQAAWAVGAVLFLLRGTIPYLRFRRAVLRDSEEFTVYENRLPVVKSRRVLVPALLGVLKPVIVLPERDYGERELALILAHESAHWKRGDLLVKFLLLCLNGLHWFNPFVYALRRAAAQNAESACDEAVLRNLDSAGRRFYGEVVLSALECAAPRHAVLCAGLSSGGKSVKRRLTAMMKFKKVSRLAAAFSLFAAIAVFAGGGALAYGARQGEALTGYTTELAGGTLWPGNIPAEEAAAIAEKVFSEVFNIDSAGLTYTLQNVRHENKAHTPTGKYLWKISTDIPDGGDASYRYEVFLDGLTGKLWLADRNYLWGGSNETHPRNGLTKMESNFQGLKNANPGQAPSEDSSGSFLFSKNDAAILQFNVNGGDGEQASVSLLLNPYAGDYELVRIKNRDFPYSEYDHY
ncbi:MAG: M56 family metallopeptidase [Clostridiales bacterium]|jgi:beta-lactamase regulating signal transducer with metallopeptidase domain|nr:M56 family metallopeptidase [Clostridiales bacterium]